MTASWIIVLVIVIVIALVLQVSEVPRYVKLTKLKVSKREMERRVAMLQAKPKAAKARVVITMTTIPPRVKYLGPIVASLLDQTVRVDEIALNIPFKSRKGQEYELPDWFESVPLLKVHRVPKDLGPGTKILPTLQREGDDTLIIAVDDDNIYGSKMVEQLVKEYYHHKGKCAITNYGMCLTKHDNHDFSYQFPYRYDRVLQAFGPRREVDFLQGCSGFLVNKTMFPDEVYHLEDGPPEAVNVDDMWLSGWLHWRLVPIMQPAMNIRFIPIPNVDSWLKTPSLISAEEAIGKRNNKVVINWFKSKGVKLQCDIRSE